MIKRIVSATLSVLMLFLSFVSCSNMETISLAPGGVSATASSAEEYGVWLEERLEIIPHDVVLGIGNSEEFDVDMTNFENDGYIIRVAGNKVIIFGKTADGLDKGVRKYANTVDLGEDVTDVVYHEGYRIDELRIFGIDISEYVIEYDGASSNENMRFAATELVQLVKKACGVELQINDTFTDRDHKIILRHSSDESLKNDGYRYFAEDGNLVIEGAVRRGCMYGVYRFLQNECGWEGLVCLDSTNGNFGDSYLAEADLIDIPADINKTETPMFEYFCIYDNMSSKNAITTTDRTEPSSAEFSYGAVDKASHGMARHRWTKTGITDYLQACYTDPDVYLNILDSVVAYIDGHIEAGHLPGESLKEIDISQADNNMYCYCEYCSEVMSEYGSVSSSIVYGANKLAEDINELYPSENGIAVLIFAYFATKIPPSSEMEINENVYITFAQNGNCYVHPMNGSLCEYSEPGDDYLVTNDNVSHGIWLEGWCDLSDNVYVWYYELDAVLHQYTMLSVLHDDFKYMKDIGVKGMFWESEYYGFGIKRVEHALSFDLMWDPYMSDAEYEAKLCRLLEREYGDGWKYIRAYIDFWYDSIERIGCSNCWGFGNNKDPEYDFRYMREHGRTMIDLIDKALSLAGSADQEYRVKVFSLHVYYSYVFSAYFTAYEAEDEATIEELRVLYNIVIERLVECGYNMKSLCASFGPHIYPTLEQEAWLIWEGERKYQILSDNLRPAPEVEDIYA